MKTTASILLIFVSIISLIYRSRMPAAPQQPASLSRLSYGWTQTWGGSGNEAAQNVAVDQAGNIYIAGEFNGTVDFDPGAAEAWETSHGAQDTFLTKLDPTGNFVWVRTWGGSARDVPGGLGVDSAGNVYVNGHFQDKVDFNPSPTVTETHTSNAGAMNNIFLSKFDPDGNFQWVRTFGPSDGGAEGYNLAIDASNNIYLVGDFTGSGAYFNPWDAQHPDWHANHPAPGSPAFDAYLSKFDSNGNLQWAKTWGGAGYDDGPGVVVDHAGNVYVTGMYGSTDIDFDPGPAVVNLPAHNVGGIVDVFLSKFDPDGNFKWVRAWGCANTDDVGQMITVDWANNLYVAGRFASTSCDFDPWGSKHELHSTRGSLDAFVSKIDSNGNFQWAKTWGGAGWDSAGGPIVDRWGTVYATGEFSGTVNFNQSGSASVTANGDYDAFLVGLDASGNFAGVKTWGNTGEDIGYRSTIDGLNRLLVVGSFSGTVDFNPGPGDSFPSNGGTDAFITLYTFAPLNNHMYLPAVLK